MMREHKNIEVRIRNSELLRLHSVLYMLTSSFCFLLIPSCQAQKINNPYFEDLSSYRPKIVFEKLTLKDSAVRQNQQEIIAPRYHVNEKIDAVLDSIDRFNLTRKFVDGYTIQIYSGQKQEQALNAQKRLVEENTRYVASVQYQQPKFRVTVGKYFTRIEAQKDLLALKKIFPSASLVPDRIMIK